MSDTSYMVYDYPDPPEEEVICCPWCGEETSDEEYEIDGMFVCESCFKGYLEDMTADELAEMLGIRHKSRYE